MNPETVLSLGLGMGSAGLGGLTNFFNNLSMMRFQAKENEIMREREDNAIQRQMIDMRKAGINPIMAGNTGGAQAGLGGGIQLSSPDFSQNFGAMQDQLASEMAINETKRHNEALEQDTDVQILQGWQELNRKIAFDEQQKKQWEDNYKLMDNEDKRAAAKHLKDLDKISAEIANLYSETELNFFKNALVEAQTDTERKRVEEMASNIVLMGKKGQEIMANIAKITSDMNVNAAQIDEIKQRIASMKNHDDYENFMKWIHGLNLAKDSIQMISSEARNWVGTITDLNPVKQIKEIFNSKGEKTQTQIQTNNIK